MGTVVLLRSGAIFWLVCVTIAIEVEVDPAWENIFRTRSDEDWREVWHTEKHRRCYRDLPGHLEWVCQKDIYSVKRKRRDAEGQPEQTEGEENKWWPFIDGERANSFLGKLLPTRRRRDFVRRQSISKRGIIEECCHSVTGCSWEEYAEYCTANSRIRS